MSASVITKDERLLQQVLKQRWQSVQPNNTMVSVLEETIEESTT